MKVQEIMTRDVELVGPDAPVREAAKRLRDLDVGALPIGENDRLVGMVTDRDIVVRGLASDRDYAQLRVRECMTPQVLYCYADEAAESVAANMARNQVRRLPVLDRSKRLVGIVALADISAHIEAQRTGDTVREISSPDIH